jgi:hypothetical protein
MNIKIVKDGDTKYTIQRADNHGYVLSELTKTKGKLKDNFKSNNTFHPTIESLVNKMLYCQLDGHTVSEVLFNMDKWAKEISDQIANSSKKGEL